MKNIYKISLILLVSLIATRCDIDEQIDPNGPSLSGIVTGAGILELNNVVTGIEARMRNGFGVYVTSTGTVSRELYLFDADPRNLQDLVGLDGMGLDNNTFYLTANYNNRYRAINNCNILLAALENSQLTDEQSAGYAGFANTVKAYQLLLVLNMLGDNGIRIDVADPDNLGPFVAPQSAAFADLATMLDDANAQLSNAGSSFPFELSDGFEGFDTPASFSQFNRAIAARVAIYREEWAQAISLLGQSFFDLDGDLTVGPEHVFSEIGADILNPLFKIPGNNGDQIIVNNDFILSAETGDSRVSTKTALRPNPTSQGGFNGTHETALYANSSSPIDIIRNEELILIYAEAQAQQSNFQEATDAINIIRSAAGLSSIANPGSLDPLIDQILFERRYSLWAEGHRMVDLRRYGLLNATSGEVPIDDNIDPETGNVLSQQIFQQFPIPLSDDIDVSGG